MTADATENRLLGTWVADSLDSDSRRRQGRVTLDFRSDGRLFRRVEQWRAEARVVEVRMFRFRLDEGLIVLRLSSPAREERVGGLPNLDGILCISLENCPTTFLREGIASRVRRLVRRLLTRGRSEGS